MSHRFNLDPRSLSREEAISFPGPDGTLEGMWRPVKPGTRTRGVVVVAHPHPAHGGTMLNKVVFHTARVLNHDLDLASLRFNFRGVGRSEGAYDEGRGETGDVLAAWEEAYRRIPNQPLVGAGFSFGAAMTMNAAATSPAHPPAALALIGMPIRLFRPQQPFPHPVPAVVVHGESDQYTPPEPVEAYLQTWPAPARFHVEPGADHFLEGHLVSATGFLSKNLKEWLQV